MNTLARISRTRGADVPGCEGYRPHLERIRWYYALWALQFMSATGDEGASLPLTISQKSPHSTATLFWGYCRSRWQVSVGCGHEVNQGCPSDIRIHPDRSSGHLFLLSVRLDNQATLPLQACTTRATGEFASTRRKTVYR